MAEYIEREALIADIDAAMDNAGMGYIVGQILKRYIKRQPAADVAQVVRGWWKHEKDHGDFYEAECTACGGILLVDWNDGLSEYRYCPNCGADMREG